ncbi:MAG TPA: phosphoribosylanthranilate isomerase [Methylomirabilota bacterium]|nr:phosphoribosylanthranilate isomerase [Methylomirabilota bacterium]
MAVRAKICGINSREALDAAVAGGASFVGFVFYPPSPRALTPAAAGELAAAVPRTVGKLGLFVDDPDERIADVLAKAPLDMLQLHGQETPARVAAIRRHFGLPVMKAVKVAGADDLAAADGYIGVADWLLFDAKPPKEMTGALPGGNALAFDWQLLAGRAWPSPWMLSGGLTPENLGEAVRISGARVVDVSSGVEAAPGQKDPAKIAAFLAEAARL